MAQRAAHHRRRLRNHRAGPVRRRRRGNAGDGRRRDIRRRRAEFGMGAFVWPVVRPSGSRTRPGARRRAQGPVEALGAAGLRPQQAHTDMDVRAVVAAVQAEVLPYEKNLFRSGSALLASLQRLDGALAG
ncbi:MAG: hypothetical protein WDN49_13605 [Acetobacteraceae bacterium]